MLPSSFKPNEKNNITYPTVEHFYQAMKSGNTFEHALIASADSPYEAKKMGRVVDKPFEYLKNDQSTKFIFDEKIKCIKVIDPKDEIDKIKLAVMYIGLYWKFSIPEWKEKLLATNKEAIIEWNNWSDKIWGVSIQDNKGDNWLGKLLMQIRNEVK